jgi:hypothetical protein
MRNAAFRGLSETTVATTANPADPTASWKTYRNEEYGFELKYPDNFSYRQSNNVVSFLETSNLGVQGEVPIISLEIVRVAETLDLNAWIDSSPSLFIGDLKPSEVSGFGDRESFAEGANTGITFEWLNMGATRAYVFEKGNTIFILFVNPSDKTGLTGIAENIISTTR